MRRSLRQKPCFSQEFSPAEPNQVWASDITYLETGEGWMYFAVVVDLYARKVVGAKIGDTGVELPLSVLDQALAVRRPKAGLLHHSDRGSQYQSRRYRAAMEARGVRVSMSRPGKCCDNAVVESFFGTMKNELRSKWEMILEGVESMLDSLEGLMPHPGHRSPDSTPSDMLPPDDISTHFMRADMRWTCEKAVMEYNNNNNFYNPKRLHRYNGQQSSDDK